MTFFLSSTFSASIGFLFNFVIYLALSLVFGIIPFHLVALFFPLLILNFFILIMGLGLIIGTLSIFLKDIQHLWDILLLFGFWATPILYDRSLIEDTVPWLLYLNPVSGIIINTRAILLYASPPDFQMLGYTLVYAIVVFLIGYYSFNKFSHKIAEKI